MPGNLEAERLGELVVFGVERVFKRAAGEVLHAQDVPRHQGGGRDARQPHKRRLEPARHGVGATLLQITGLAKSTRCCFPP